MANEGNLKPFQWKPGQSGNPAGRPRRTFSKINAELKERGVEPLTKTTLVDTYSLVFSATEEELVELEEDGGTPFALRLIIRELKDKSTRSKALADYRDYMFGRAQGNERVEITPLSSEEREARIKELIAKAANGANGGGI